MIHEITNVFVFLNVNGNIGKSGKMSTFQRFLSVDVVVALRQRQTIKRSSNAFLISDFRSPKFVLLDFNDIGKCFGKWLVIFEAQLVSYRFSEGEEISQMLRSATSVGEGVLTFVFFFLYVRENHWRRST